MPNALSQAMLKKDPITKQMQVSKQGLRVMTYNVLATTLTNEFEYGINPEYLKMENRQPVIRQEIAFVNPDILCLQETEEHTELHNYLLTDMAMDFKFFKKQDPTKSDGCAVFFKRSKFILVSSF